MFIGLKMYVETKTKKKPNLSFNTGHLSHCTSFRADTRLIDKE